MTDLSHRASFHSFERTTPSNPGIEQLGHLRSGRRRDAGLATGAACALADAGHGGGGLCLGTLAILSRLEPVGPIVRGRNRLSAGDLGTRVTRSGAPEFRKIADAVNRLAQQLTASTGARRVLTRRLIEV
ncbi:HAMP domain-containing protein [Rhodovulum visakhapatnamense]|uniref:HAMP domain-containing protein n=1 Tax=Rhodovulum visakhapatnamense TaxID=364297 RepID=UPI003B21D48E